VSFTCPALAEAGAPTVGGPCHRGRQRWPALPPVRRPTSPYDAVVLNQTCHVVRAAALALPQDSRSPLDPGQIVSGSPAVHVLPLAQDAAVEVGLWQHTVGVSTYVEADEVFIVLSGRATIDVVDGPTLQVGPGDVGFLSAGARTVWTVHEDLRKVYLVRP
jgi:uncharacterized cupin superfamily protein